RFVNEFKKQNRTIYNPEHGIDLRLIETEAPENASQSNASLDLGSVVCTLEVEDRTFANLKRIFKITKESVGREALSRLVSAMDYVHNNLDILKKFLPEEEYYTLDELYTNKYEGTNMALVDYGIKIIIERYSKIEELVTEIRIKRLSNSDPVTLRKISELFTRDELKILISIGGNPNLRRIKSEKNIQKNILDAAEYMKNNPNLFKELDTLRINTDLSNFYEEYIVKTGFKNMVDRNRALLDREIEEKKKAVEEKKSMINRGQVREEEKENAIRFISETERNIHSLEYDQRNEYLNSFNPIENIKFASSLSPVQKTYILKKMEEEFEKTKNIKIVRVEVPDEKKASEERKAFRENIARADMSKIDTSAMKEVKLKIDVKGIIEASQSSEIKDIVKTVGITGIELCRFLIIQQIFDKNIEIEGPYSDEEKQKILNTFKNNICRYFMHFDDQNESGAMYSFYNALKGKNSDEFIGKKCAAIINNVIGLNIFIYNPEHGIYKQSDKNEAPENVLREDQSIDLSPRTCTIKIDDAKFSNIENLRWFTLGNLGREHLCRRNNLYSIDDMDIFKKYATDKTYYTLDELYTKRCKGTDIPLIDYGLNLIFEQCYNISVLIKEAKEAKASSDNSAHNKIEKEIKKIFTKQEDLNIAVSIYNNIGPIIDEKDIHSGMVKVLEYILNLKNFLEEKNGTKILKINADLSNFCEDYIVKTELEKIINDEKRSIKRKKSANSESFEIKNKELSAKEAELEEWKKTADPNSQDYKKIEKEKMEEIKHVKHDINCLA
ncbi:hypothetical protein NEMIN01_2492, partial [Nematocida minor]|uniref:uncharacterized protein n=1 Tax=Nematocida minor TaxID=1912983 RepID=UPI00221F2FC7